MTWNFALSSSGKNEPGEIRIGKRFRAADQATLERPIAEEIRFAGERGRIVTDAEFAGHPPCITTGGRLKGSLIRGKQGGERLEEMLLLRGKRGEQAG